MPSCFTDYYQGRAGLLRKHYRNSYQYFSVDSIHDLRVELKRLRAFFRLVESINPGFESKPGFRRLRRLFKAAGGVRDPQVQLELVRKRSKKLELNLSEYWNQLKYVETSARKKYDKFCRKFDIGAVAEGFGEISGYLALLPPDYVITRAESALSRRLDELVELRNSEPLKEYDLHLIRILTKEARYILEVLRLCYPDQSLYDQLDSSLRSVHQVLGRWHDADVGLEFVDSFLKTQGQETITSRESYERFQQSLRLDAEENLDAFAEHWASLVDQLRQRGFIRDQEKTRSN
jgi:CHAD domain-containing protein